MFSSQVVRLFRGYLKNQLSRLTFFYFQKINLTQIFPLPPAFPHRFYFRRPYLVTNLDFIETDNQLFLFSYNNTFYSSGKFTSMRISTSPLEIRNQIFSKPNQIQILPQNNRSNSLSNSTLHPSKFMTRPQNSYCSPYYNQNSAIFYPSQQQPNYESKVVTKTLGNLQNSHTLQNTIKNLSQRVQLMESQLKRQQSSIKILEQTGNQKGLMERIQQKINQQVQSKSHSKYELLFQQIKRLETDISQKVQLHNESECNSLGSIQFLESSKKKGNEQENVYTQTRIIKIMEEKVKEEIFKLQIHLENQINKALKIFKNTAQSMNNGSSSFSILSRSKLKFQHPPLKILIKNQISAHLQNQVKSKKQTVSTSYSTGSSEQNQGKNKAQILDYEEQTYFIDKQGYLLDEHGFYLLDAKDKMIKVDRKLVKRLRQYNMIN